MKFTVDRSKWVNASFGNRGHTLLLNREGYSCCLGFVCSQLGIKDEEMQGYGSPNHVCHDRSTQTTNFDLLSKLKSLTQYHYGYVSNTSLAERAIRINDNANISREHREKDLIDLFAEYGHELKFVGEY